MSQVNKLHDLVIVLPGIMGSVLSRDGKPIWELSRAAASQAFWTGGRSITDLKLEGDGSEPDGVLATALMPSVDFFWGLKRMAGYDELMVALEDNFEFIYSAGKPQNVLEFPYDWRRDIRQTAKLLQRFIEVHLDSWRKLTKNPKAQVILIAHSMGGLVSRHWLEVLGGWPDCKALITFGTPHRGSAEALNFIVNGLNVLWVDLGAMLRSFPALYQLMPRYKMVSVGGAAPTRPAETPELPLDHAMALDAYNFHLDIEKAVNANDSAHGKERYIDLPFVGAHQPTLQSGLLTANRDEWNLTMSNEVPAGVSSELGFGDGTVPRVSATPLELSAKFRDTFYPERHGNLQANKGILFDLVNRLIALQNPDTSEVRSLRDVEKESASALSVDVPYGFEVGEDVVIGLGLVNAQIMLGTPQATFRPLDGGSRDRVEAFLPSGEGWKLTAGGFNPGLYAVTVGVVGGGTELPSVHEIFEVRGSEAP
jgi:pimeloyl-ACP methyl ester carboxylesterase